MTQVASILEPYFTEALFLVEEGISPYRIDTVIKEKLGVLLGPFEMMDIMGKKWRNNRKHQKYILFDQLKVYESNLVEGKIKKRGIGRFLIDNDVELA